MNNRIFENYFKRVGRVTTSERIENFSFRMHSAPTILSIFSTPVALILGRNPGVDSFLIRIPFVNLLAKFLIGNAMLIMAAEESTDATESKEFLSSNIKNEIYDVIVIGSGPGGAIAALREAEKGKKVLVIEAGKSYSPGSIEHHSLTQTVNQFANSGLSFVWGIKPVLYAEGRTFGGGSEVNSGLYHRIEGKHRKKILDTVKVSDSDWEKLEELVEQEISVQVSPIEQIPDHGLVKGALVNGLVTKEIPRWRRYSPIEEHQSMQVTYLHRAKQLGVDFITGTKVKKIQPLKESVTIFAQQDGREINFSSKEVVVSAGTIETPRILLRSRLIENSFPLNFHPMLRAVGMQSSNINDGDLFPSWQAWTDNLEYKYGYSVSTFPYLAATLSSLGERKKHSEEELSKMAAYFSSFAIVDSKAKLMRIGSRLIPVVIWGKNDRNSMRRSTAQLLELLKAGDAIEVWPKKGTSPVTTVHLFGSIPLGISDQIDELGQLISEKRIRISDGSLIPHAPWGNPQGAIMVLCELMSIRRDEK